MSFADSAADGATGGTGGYGGGNSSSGGGRSGGRGGGGYSGAVGHGVDSAHGGTSSVGSDGSVSGLGGGSGSQSGTTRGGTRASTTSRASVASEDGISQAAIDSAQSVASFGSVTDGAIASFSDESERSFMDRVDARPDPQAGFSAQADLQPMSQAERESRATQSIAENASPGLIGRALSFATGIANPVAGIATDTVARSLDAQRATKEHNAEFGMDLDTSIASHLGEQAKGTVAGFAGGKFGGLLGGRALAGINPVAGSLVGSMALSNTMRDAAMSPSEDNESQNSTTSPGVAGSGGGLMASNANAQPQRSLTQQTSPTASRPDYGPTDFSGYASYAESFFS